MASVSEIACVSACGELIRGRFQTRDGCGEPFAPYRVIVEIAPVSRDVANEACSVFTERPSRACIRAEIPLRERPVFRKRRSRGRLKWRRGLGEFGTRGFLRGCMYGASRAACCVFCLRNARSGFPGRYARAGCKHGARVTSLPHGSAVGRDVGIAHKDERACRKPPPWRCKKETKPRFRYMTLQDVLDIL